MPKGIPVLVKKKKNKQGKSSKSHADRNLGPARKRYRDRFFDGKLGRKAKKLLAKRNRAQ